MASDHLTYNIVHDAFNGPWLGAAEAPSGSKALIPSPLYAGDSFDLKITCYEFFSATAPAYCDFPAAPIAKTINNAAAVDKGGGLVGIPITAHTFTAGRTVVIAGTVAYNGTYQIVSQTTDEIVITVTYVAETFTGAETAVQQGATASLYIKRANTAEVPTLVCAGVISAVGGSVTKRAILTFSIMKDDLPAALAGSSQCLLFAQVVDPTIGDEFQFTLQQYLYLYDHDGDESSNPTAGNMPYTPAVSADWVATAPDDVAEALDDIAARPLPWETLSLTAMATLDAISGHKWVHCNTTSGSGFAVTLPAAASGGAADQEFILLNTGTHTLTITPAGVETINGAAGSQTIVTQYGCMLLKSNGTNGWYAPTFITP